MHITLEADYAVRTVDFLAQNETRCDAKNISEKTMVPLRFCLKILRKLVAAGIVKSFKGVHGGYQLAQSPEKITLGQAIEAVEGPYYFSRCLEDQSLCSRGAAPGCAYHKVYAEISEMVRKKLDEVTFEDFRDAEKTCV